MKKTLLFLIAATAMMMAGCSNDDFGGATQGMTLNATVEQPASRATMTEETDGNYQFSFTDKDQINVTNTQVSNYYTFTKLGKTFTSTDAKTTTVAADWYAYFPGNTVDLTGQKGDLAGVANHYACAGKTAEVTTGANGLAISLTPKVAILRIVKVDNSSTPCDINITTTGGWISGMKAQSSVADFDVETSPSKVTLLSQTAAGVYYIAVPAGKQITIYNGGTKLKATKPAGLTAGKYYTVTTGPVTGTAEATINNETKEIGWVQLWAGGPKFATQNVATPMNWTTAVKNEFWGGNWRVPTQDELNGLVGYVVDDKTFTNGTVKVEYCQQENVFGFKFTGVQPGYTENHIFLPATNEKTHTIKSGFGNYWTSYKDPNGKCATFSLSYDVDSYFYTHFAVIHEDYNVYTVRPVLK